MEGLLDNITKLKNLPKNSDYKNLSTNIESILLNLSDYNFEYIISIFFFELKTISQWKKKLEILKYIQILITKFSNQNKKIVSINLPNLIPKIMEFIHDTRQDISLISKNILEMSFRCIENKDFENFIDKLSNAMISYGNKENIIQQLSGIVFIQTIDGSSLSLIVPIVLSGLRENKSNIRRLCSRIIHNISKLIENPLEIKPFLNDLIYSLNNVLETIPDPEARSVVKESHKHLLKLQALIPNFENTFNSKEYIKKFLDKNMELNENSYYLACKINTLVKLKINNFDIYKTELQDHLTENQISDIYKMGQEVLQNNIIIDDNENVLCDCTFTLSYGTNILLNNTKLKLIQGKKYGLVGKNDSGKTTLMRSIANEAIDGFPPKDTVKTVFVEADIQGELSHLNCVNYILESPEIKKIKINADDVRSILKKVGFTEGNSSGGDCDANISSLSGGWRMKLALARAMLQKADIILMDEPTNHLDVKNVKWVKNYINSLNNTTVIMVSHDSGLLDDCCDYIIHINELKLNLHKGNLTNFVKQYPEANSYFEFKSVKFKFRFPQPCFLEGIKSKGKALLKMDNVSFTYPGNATPTIKNISIKASMASRVACVGINGAGKSTMIKVLTGVLEPTSGLVWKYPNSRIGYIAQHAFHHIEKHLDKTPNEYIRWRFQLGNDREGLDNASMKLTDNEYFELSKPFDYCYETDTGSRQTESRVILRCTGQRRETKIKRIYEYEVSWRGLSESDNSWFKEQELLKINKLYSKIIKNIDQKISNKNNMAFRALTQENVEKHLSDIGLESEYATHYRINSLSGGQKVKVVLAAAMWDQPHILILDEPTNYLDRDSLGALADAIENYAGGVIMITHNDAFCRKLCPERWVLENGNLNTEGDVDWMSKTEKQEVDFQEITEYLDANGNLIKIKQKKKLNNKQKRKIISIIKKKIQNGDDLDSEEEEYAAEFNL